MISCEVGYVDALAEAVNNANEKKTEAVNTAIFARFGMVLWLKLVIGLL